MFYEARSHIKNLYFRKKHMNNWLSVANIALATAGSFQALDTAKNPIIHEWEKIDPKSPRLNDKIRELSDIFIAYYLPAEMEFIRKCPELVPQDFMLNSLAHLVNQTVVDWFTIEQQAHKILQNFLTQTDWPQYAQPEDIQLFVIAKDAQTGDVLGARHFLINSECENGSVRVGFLGVSKVGQNRGIEQLLLSSIFRIVPETTRLFLHVRETNKTAQELYATFGFTHLRENYHIGLILNIKLRHLNVCNKQHKD